MPEYLAPGVFVEETSFRAKSIEGVSTTTTGFVGPTRYGPLDIEPEIVTSLVEFERTYGGKDRLGFVNSDDSSTAVDNYMWHAARAFFEEGGKRLYVSRVYTPAPGSPPRGYSTATVGTGAPLRVRARFPGQAGDAQVSFTFNVGQNVLVAVDPSASLPVPAVRSLRDRDVVLISAAVASPPAPPAFYLALRDAQSGAWSFSPSGLSTGSPSPMPLGALVPGVHEVRVVTVSVSVDPFTSGAVSFTEAELPLDPRHQLGDAPDSLFDAFAPHTRDPGAPAAKVISNLARARSVPIVIDNPGNLDNGIAVLEAFLGDAAALGSPLPTLRDAVETLADDRQQRTLVLSLSGGDDGQRPQASDYAGQADPITDVKTGLLQFEDLEEISIVAAPGSTFGYESDGYGPQSRTIVRNLINHAQKMRYRIAVLDSGDNQSIGQVRAMRGQLDSTYGALYYPWIRVLDPLSQREIFVPPSGFVSGIYARNDVNRAVYKAPANEVVNLALGFERFLNKSQQEVLNPEGINCFRFFEGRGMRLWGARTISSDPEWKYVNLRRYFAYVERSIDKGTQWAVFEPNGEQLWANVRRTIEDFLLNEWQSGALLGDKPEKAYFVKCDRSTMSQNDLDNGRLICLIGLAPLRPAEFVIFRIGQWTADRKS